MGAKWLLDWNLGWGIPVVGVAKSDEYFEKLSELVDEFPSGIQALRFNAEYFPDRLISCNLLPVKLRWG